MHRDDQPPRRRPPPATGRQDQHPPPSPRKLEREDLALEPLPGPRGAEYYARAHSQTYGLGCLIVLGVGAALVALVFLVLALIPARDDGFLPAAAPTARDSAPDPAPDAAPRPATPPDEPEEPPVE